MIKLAAPCSANGLIGLRMAVVHLPAVQGNIQEPGRSLW